MIRGKAWGHTRVLLQRPTIEMHRMSIAPNYRCSMHKHCHKWNAFLVISGTLTIFVRKNDYPLEDKTRLGPGEIMEVAPGEFHRFESGEDPVDALELYYLEPLSDDIVREDCGGAVNAASIAKTTAKAAASP